MSTQTLPSGETVAIDWLVAHAGVGTLVGDRIYTESPERVTYPFVRIERVAGTAFSYHWLDQVVLQVSAWATTRVLAREICETAVAALHELPGQSALAVVSDVTDVIGPRAIPDLVAKVPRFIAEVQLTLHPITAAS